MGRVTGEMHQVGPDEVYKRQSCIQNGSDRGHQPCVVCLVEVWIRFGQCSGNPYTCSPAVLVSQGIADWYNLFPASHIPKYVSTGYLGGILWLLTDKAGWSDSLPGILCPFSKIVSLMDLDAAKGNWNVTPFWVEERLGATVVVGPLPMAGSVTFGSILPHRRPRQSPFSADGIWHLLRTEYTTTT